MAVTLSGLTSRITSLVKAGSLLGHVPGHFPVTARGRCSLTARRQLAASLTSTAARASRAGRRRGAVEGPRRVVGQRLVHGMHLRARGRRTAGGGGENDKL